jgi:hypothetical protein
VSAPSTRPEAARGPRDDEPERRRGRIAVPLAVGLFAFLGRLVPVLRGGGLFGRDTYDPFVYYSAAVSLWSGRLPYRDFLLLHPPGMLVALLPFAGLGAVAGDPVGMAAARVAIMLTGAGSAVLIYLLLRPRGLAAAAIGAGLYAAWFPAFYTERDVRLEAVAGFLVLAGILVVQRWHGPRRSLPPLLAGALFGAAAMVKLWGVVGVLVLVAWLWWHHGPRRAVLAAFGAALAAGQLLLPFATVLPRFVQWSVIDQLGRTRSQDSVVNRLVDIVGLGPVPQPAVLALLVVALALVIVSLRIAFSDPEGRLQGWLVLGGGAVLLAAPTWYPHYPALVAGPLCLAFGNAVAVLLSRLPRPGLRLVLASLAAGLVAAQILLLSQSVGHRFPGRELAAVLQPRPGCVTTDRPAALVLSDMLRRNLARDCPVVVDPLGYKSAAQRAGVAPEDDARRFNRFLTDYLGSGSSAVLVTVRPDDLGPENAARIASWPVVGSAGRYLVRAPIPATPARAWEEVLDSIHPQTQARYP